jgi:Zn-dependent alcohol dehydrogenase
LYKDGTLKLDELVSRRIGLDGINDAFRSMEAGEVARSVVDYGI